MPEHSVITDPNIHEPKGVASAAAGRVYVADGAGSGSWSSVGAATTVFVTSSSDLAGTLDSSKVYIIDGSVDMGSQTIVVPSGGLTLLGYNLRNSKLTSTVGSYTMFTGGGDLFMNDLTIDVSGASSSVFNLSAATGLEAFEINMVNFENCTSLGTISGYRQGLEMGTGRFGGTPNLTLAGTWLGGYFISTSIVRSLSAGMTGALYEAGASFVMNSRFRSNQNIDLPTSAAFVDFAPSNFANPSTLQLEGCIISRNGTIDSSDANITPNIDHFDLESAWSNNQGLSNTHVGGVLTIGTEVATTLSGVGVYSALLGTWDTSNLQHFDSPSNGQLRHLGNDPSEYKVTISLMLDSAANDDLSIRLRKYDASAASTSTVKTERRQVNSLTGGRDVAFVTMFANVDLDQNDYVFLQVANNTTTSSITAELESTFFLEAR